jgi:hypothetical protein
VKAAEQSTLRQVQDDGPPAAHGSQTVNSVTVEKDSPQSPPALPQETDSMMADEANEEEPSTQETLQRELSDLGPLLERANAALSAASLDSSEKAKVCT